MQIPHLFHFIWVDGSPPLPGIFKGFVKRWEELHPDWEIRWWSTPDGPLQNQDLYDHASAICHPYEGQFRSDIWRYEILWKHGGVYVDVDFEPFKPLDSLLEDVECFTAWELQDQYANNAIFGCTPGHPFLRDLIDELPGSVASHPEFGPWMISGPRHMTRTLAKHPEVKVFPQAMFYPIGCKHIDRLGHPEHYGDAWAVHWWNNAHRRRGKSL
ncbi:MAG: hypothetical protein GX630_10710 [Actinobacteria bacterium]|nr:hypothetical protein [Actinomycetota bacterium]